MIPSRIDQLLAGFVEGDAISHEARLLQTVFRECGFESELYADPAHVSSRMAGACRPLAEYEGAPDACVIYHYAIGSPAAASFLGSSAKKVLRYHNITPARYFDGFSDESAIELRAGRAALRDACAASDAIWAVSEFNADEIRALGQDGVEVFPLAFRSEAFGTESDLGVTAEFSDALTTILFVGRIVPNKKIEDLILAFAWYARTLNPYSRLLLIGSERSCPSYFSMLRLWACCLNLPNVCFQGFVNSAALASYYGVADAFVCVSEHEGYGLPLVEAMHNEIPVLARNCGGVAEALGGGGVLFDDLAPREVAALLHLVLSDASLRQEVLASQAARLATVAARRLDEELRGLLERIA